jgi:hypothetical protein
MLATLDQLMRVPGVSIAASLSPFLLGDVLNAADRAIKTYCKRDLELRYYTEYYSGTNREDLILKQYPVWQGRTTIASGSNGAVLPQATINVVSTDGFPLGNGGDTTLGTSTLAVQVGVNTYTTVSYTGVTATSFTGCTGGTGTLSSSVNLNGVYSPAVWQDATGYYGQSPGGFSDGTLLTLGSNFVVTLDSGGRKSNRGLLRRIGGSSGRGFEGFCPYAFGGGKLGGYRLPYWGRGEGNVKVSYAAGYSPAPYDLTNACLQLCTYLIRNMPQGSPLSSESLGSYSYSVLQASAEVPELGSLARTLAPYREVSW